MAANQSLQNANTNQNPSTQTTFWVPLNFAWTPTASYSINQNAIGDDGILYTSLQNSNAFLIAPPVPKGLSSTEYVILILL
jgi:hypothetical protein